MPSLRGVQAYSFSSQHFISAQLETAKSIIEIQNCLMK